ncbi:MAG: fibronectin type 3 domain-containing protein, partial [Verrucomicrobiales bacterium]
SGDSEIVTVTTTDLPPSAPANLTAIAGDQLVTVDWDDNTETDVAGYNVYRSDVTGPLNGATPIVGNGVVDTGLSNGTTYSYFVTAVDIMGNESGFSATVSATPTATAEQFLHVESIDMAVTQKGKNWKAEASVLVTDQSGNPLAGATVTGDWLYNDLPNSSGTVATTDASGIAVLTSSPEKAKSLDEFRFTVTGVALTGFTYDNGGTTESSVFVP